MAKANTSEKATVSAGDNSVQGEDDHTPIAGSGYAESGKKLMYLGPTIVENGVIFRHGQIFNNGLPAAWLEKVKSSADFKLLLVAFDKVAAVRAKLVKGGSVFAKAAETLRLRNLENLKGGSAQ